MSRRAIRIMGAAGLVLTIFGAILYGILYSSGWKAVLPLLAGIALSVTAFAAEYRSNASEGFRRSARYGFGTGLSVLFLLALTVFLQTMSERHGLTVDLTGNRRFSLAPQTRKVLDGLDREIRFTAFFKEAETRKTRLMDLLSAYRDYEPSVSYVFIDPDREPMTARRFGVNRTGVVFAESGGMRERLDEFDESALTNAIAKISEGAGTVVCFSSGHGEKPLSGGEPTSFSALREALESENYEIREILLLGLESVPPDCDVLVIAGPEKDVVKREQNMILDFMTSGGSVLLLADPMVDLPNVSGIAASFGMILNNDVIVDRYGKLLAGNYLTPVVNRYGDHPVTDGFRYFSFFPQARSLSVSGSGPGSAVLTPLGSTNETAYGETDLARLLEGQTQFEPSEDVQGPLHVAIAGEMQTGAGEGDGTGRARMIIFGDSDFAVDSNLRLSGNRDLILNSIGWLAEKEDLIAVRSGDDLFQPVLLSATQGRLVFWIPVMGLPALVAAAGSIVLARRRRRS